MTLDLKAYKRTPWSFSFAILGENYASGAFAMQVRQHPGDGGAAMLTATMTAAYETGFSYWDGRRQIATPATVITASIAEAALEALPLAANPSRPLELVYDVHVTPSGGEKFVLTGGKFTVLPGVTL